MATLHLMHAHIVLARLNFNAVVQLAHLVAGAQAEHDSPDELADRRTCRKARVDLLKADMLKPIIAENSHSRSLERRHAEAIMALSIASTIT